MAESSYLMRKIRSDFRCPGLYSKGCSSIAKGSESLELAERRGYVNFPKR